jgi:hypothetical protein
LWRSLLAILAAAGLGYPLFQATIPVVSQMTLLLGRKIHTLSQPEEVVATNLVPQQFPFPEWDVGSTGYVALAADRNTRPGVANRAQLEALAGNFKTNRLEVLYMFDPARPIDDALRRTLDGTHPVEEWRFAVPEEPPSLALRLRSFYWKLAAKHQVSASASKSPEITLRFYRFLIRSRTDGEVTLEMPQAP